MFCSNFVEYWLIALATWTCGGCVMPLNCEMEPKNLENQLTLGKAKILVCDELNIADAIGKYIVPFRSRRFMLDETVKIFWHSIR